MYVTPSKNHFEHKCFFVNLMVKYQGNENSLAENSKNGQFFRITYL